MIALPDWEPLAASLASTTAAILIGAALPGGPRYDQGQLVRLPLFEASQEPAAPLPLRQLQHLLPIRWGGMGLALLLTALGLRHG